MTIHSPLDPAAESVTSIFANISRMVGLLPATRQRVMSAIRRSISALLLEEATQNEFEAALESLLEDLLTDSAITLEQKITLLDGCIREIHSWLYGRFETEDDD
ncbi:hypothetical protein [Deinococcus sp.]|uniref:hypothetical protein n=1 Tax=Deinococcus sp. TaxID=47478 RepID=UPI003B5C2E41